MVAAEAGEVAPMGWRRVEFFGSKKETDPKSYEDFRCSYRDTRSTCQAQGISFIPMVMEAVGGGWGTVARGVWSELAKSSALSSGELQTERSCAIMLRQRLSMTLHRENARARLKRFSP